METVECVKSIDYFLSPYHIEHAEGQHTFMHYKHGVSSIKLS